MIRHLVILAAAASMTFGLAGCGKQGDLEQPAPMWGARNRAEYEAQRRHQAEIKAREAQGDQIQTLPDEGPGSNPNTNPAPPRTVPLPGQSPRPSDASPPGAIPDPYQRPQ